MSLPNIPQIQQTSEEANRFMQSVTEKIGQIVKCPLLDGRLIQDVELEIGDNNIEHKLGRNLLGYLVTTQDQASSFSNTTPEDEVDVYLVLNSSAICVVDLWVF